MFLFDPPFLSCPHYAKVCACIFFPSLHSCSITSYKMIRFSEVSMRGKISRQRPGLEAEEGCRRRGRKGGEKGREAKVVGMRDTAASLLRVEGILSPPALPAKPCHLTPLPVPTSERKKGRKLPSKLHQYLSDHCRRTSCSGSAAAWHRTRRLQLAHVRLQSARRLDCDSDWQSEPVRCQSEAIRLPIFLYLIPINNIYH